jgi:hypothetical protein
MMRLIIKFHAINNSKVFKKKPMINEIFKYWSKFHIFLCRNEKKFLILGVIDFFTKLFEFQRVIVLFYLFIYLLLLLLLFIYLFFFFLKSQIYFKSGVPKWWVAAQRWAKRLFSKTVIGGSCSQKLNWLSKFLFSFKI